MKYNYVLLAEILRRMRLFMGYSKRSLAEAVGISIFGRNYDDNLTPNFDDLL